MKIDFQNNGNHLNLRLDGRLDTVTAPELESFLKEHGANANSLTIDCQSLAYVSSAGLRVLLAAQKKFKNSMKLKNVGELVMEVFEMTGFADILVIE